jgi:hypothetical protein
VLKLLRVLPHQVQCNHVHCPFCRDGRTGTEVERSGEQSAGGALEVVQTGNVRSADDNGTQGPGRERERSGAKAEAAFANGEVGSLGEPGGADAQSGGIPPQGLRETDMDGATKGESVGQAAKSGSGGCNSAVASTSSCQAASGIKGGVNGAAASFETVPNGTVDKVCMQLHLIWEFPCLRITD